MDLASKSLLGGPNCDARHDGTDILVVCEQMNDTVGGTCPASRMTPVQAVRRTFRRLGASLTGRSRRLWAAAEAQALGYGGVAVVTKATGISRRTIMQCLNEPPGRTRMPADRIRRPGGGRSTAHPDRDAQFRSINAAVARQLRGGRPAVSVDTKRKELVGDVKNRGRTWRPRGAPEPVRVHDFLDPAKGKVVP